MCSGWLREVLDKKFVQAQRALYYPAVSDAERGQIQYRGERNVATVLPQTTSLLEKPLEMKREHWRECLDHQLLCSVGEDDFFAG